MPRETGHVAPDPDGIARLAALYPRAFFLVGSDRRPLKIGVDRDLHAADTGLSRRQLRQTLSRYVGSAGYLEAMREGAARIDLAGEPAGTVIAAEELHAVAKLLEREAKAATPTSESEPTPALPAAPKRLGLADLRAAARERREQQTPERAA
jgi:ProP effector